MIQPLILLVAISAAFMVVNQTLGYRMSFDIGYGAFTLMAMMISATFLWLWMRRATPLAMGMAFGWAGAASVMGWWWMYNLLSKPPVVIDSPLMYLLLSVYFVGAILHFQVIWQTFGARNRLYILPIAVCVAASVLAQHLT